MAQVANPDAHALGHAASPQLRAQNCRSARTPIAVAQPGSEERHRAPTVGRELVQLVLEHEQARLLEAADPRSRLELHLAAESFLFAAEARAGTSANAAAARTAAARKAALEDNYSSRLITCQPYGLFTGSYSAIPISPGASEKPTSPNAGTIRSRENSPGAGVTPEFASP